MRAKPGSVSLSLAYLVSVVGSDRVFRWLRAKEPPLECAPMRRRKRRRLQELRCCQLCWQPPSPFAPRLPNSLPKTTRPTRSISVRAGRLVRPDPPAPRRQHRIWRLVRFSLVRAPDLPPNTCPAAPRNRRISLRPAPSSRRRLPTSFTPAPASPVSGYRATRPPRSR